MSCTATTLLVFRGQLMRYYVSLVYQQRVAFLQPYKNCQQQKNALLKALVNNISHNQVNKDTQALQTILHYILHLDAVHCDQ